MVVRAWVDMCLPLAGTPNIIHKAFSCVAPAMSANPVFDTEKTESLRIILYLKGNLLRQLKT